PTTSKTISTTAKPTTSKTTSITAKPTTSKTISTTAKPTTSKTTSITAKPTTSKTNSTTTKPTTSKPDSTTANPTAATTISTDLSSTTQETTVGITAPPVTAPPITAPPVTDSTQTSTVTESEPEVTTTTIRYYLETPIYGIDVSQWQGNVDFNAAKASGYADFVIIKAGSGTSFVDPYFHQNIKRAQEAGLGVGIYWYSYAHSPEQARLEAEACYNTIKNYSFDYPIYFDFEEPNVINSYSTAYLSSMVDTFCSTMEQKGYYTGLYSSASCLQWNLYRHVVEKYDIWVAQYNSAVTVFDGQYGIWQFTGSGNVSGISALVDRNICYKNYPAIIGVNPKGGNLPPIHTTTATTLVPANAKRGFIVEDSTTTAVDWTEFDSDTHDYAMLAVDGTEDFDILADNIDAAHEAGIKCGILYRAEDSEIEEVPENFVKLYEMLSERTLEYPIYYWFDKDISEYSVSAEQLSANASVFCSYFEGNGYYVGIAAYDTVLKDSIDNGLYEAYDLWLFNEQETPVDFKGSYGMISIWDEETGGYAHYAKMNFPKIIENAHL
ncbi:MAG: hypothetical protein K2J37_05120, partial [Ruminococcus sp.]|nr:hypothetical protein [Ruminococcus sp.]